MQFFEKMGSKLSAFFIDRKESDWQDTSFYGQPRIYIIRSPFNKFRDNFKLYFKKFAEPRVVIAIIGVFTTIIIALMKG